MKNIIEYKDEYKSSVDSAILRCLNARTSTNDKEGFSSLIYYLKEKYEFEMYDIKYYILCAFQNNSIDSVLGYIYESIFIEMIKSLLDYKFNEICDSVSYSILYTDSRFELFIEFYKNARLIEGKKFFDELKQLIPDITIHRTVNGELRD